MLQASVLSRTLSEMKMHRTSIAVKGAMTFGMQKKRGNAATFVYEDPNPLNKAS